MPSSNKIFQLSNVSYNIEDKPILDNLSLSLQGEKIYALIGPSGAGKTTLLHLLAGLLKLQAGQLSFDNKSPQEAIISIVPQEYGLLPWQTVRQAVLEGCKINQKRLTDDDLAEIEQLLSHMELIHLQDKYPNQLSGGQKQRVAITRALATRSELLLLDEPFSALDAFTREKAQVLFLDNWQRAKRLTVIVTHDIEEALLLAHEVIVMQPNPGKVKTVVSSPFQNKSELEQYRRSEILFQASLALRKEIEG